MNLDKSFEKFIVHFMNIDHSKSPLNIKYFDLQL